MGASCFFIGHREADPAILPALSEAVERHITEYGVTEFFVGQYGGFDRPALRAVQDAKKRHDTVMLTVLWAYLPRDPTIPLPEGADGSFYPPGLERVPKRAAIVRANRYMADTCDYLIAWVRHTASNAGELLEYASRREGGPHITNLAEGPT